MAFEEGREDRAADFLRIPGSNGEGGSGGPEGDQAPDPRYCLERTTGFEPATLTLAS